MCSCTILKRTKQNVVELPTFVRQICSIVNRVVTCSCITLLSHSQTNNCSLGMKQLPHNSSAKERGKLHSLHLQFCGNSVNLRSKRPRRRRDAYHKFIAQDSRLFPKSPKSASLTHKLSSRIICVSCVTQRVIVNDLARCISSNELQLTVGTIQLLEDIA